jgi:hypothetical protein
VKPTQTIAKFAPKLNMGLFATLCGLFHAEGSGASKTGGGAGPSSMRRPGRTFHPLSRLKCCVPVLLCAVAGALAFTAAPALAAPPEEAPETTTATPTATTAVLRGVLNPGKAGTPGSYQFSYAQSATECTPGTLAPEPPEFAMGAEKEAKSVTVEGLEPNKEYSFCIVAYGFFGGVAEPAFGSPVPFTTLTEKPSVDAESPSGVSSTAATLEAQINANNQETTYVFEYSTKEKAGVLEGTIVKVPATPPTPLEGFGDQTATVPTNTLLAGTTYFYRVVAKNAAGTTDGTVSATGFTTPPAPKTEAVTAITATTATFHGKLKPLNEKVVTEYEFDYNAGEEPACTGEQHTEPVSAGTGKATEATATTAVTALEPSQKYTVCLVSKNEFGSEVSSTPVHFETPAAAPTIEASSVKAGGVSPYEATLEAQLNPDNEPTTYVFEYSTTESGGALTGTIVKLESASPLEGGEQTASAATGHALTPGTTYHVRLTAKNASGSVEGSGEFATPALIAPAVESESVSEVTTELAIFATSVNPEYQETTCAIEYGTEPALSSGTSSVPCPEPLGSGGAPVGVSVPVTGLAPETTYYYRATATNPSGTTTDGTIESFTTATATAPVIESENSASIEATAANLEATIAPGAAITTYQFEYLTEAQYDAAGKAFTGAATVAGAKTISPEATHTSVNAVITGLTPATTYVYRVVATNRCAAGNPCVTDGATSTFTTSEASGTAPEACANAARRAEQPDAKDLPDCRAYEIVSPAETGGNDATDGDNVRAAASGGREEAFTYASRGAFAGPASALDNSQLLSRREPERGRWGTRSINPPDEPDGSGDGPTGYRGAFFTPDLTDGLTVADVPLTSAPETAPAGLPEMYLADLASGVPSSYRLVSQLPPSEAEYAEPYEGSGETGVYVLGTSGDLSHVVFTTSANAGAQVGPIHEWVNGQVGFVAVSNENEVWRGARLGNGARRLPQEYQDVWRAVSENGERVIFGNEGQLYIREHGVEQEQSALNAEKECTEPAKACTVQVDAAEEGAPGPSGGGRYWGASVEGERVFFTDEHQLTTNSTAESGAPDLYEYETEPGHVYGHLTDLTVGEAGAHANVQGVMQISEDGSDVYFVAKGVLTGAEENQHHEKATGEEDNLYLSSGGHITFVATLSPNDASEWESSQSESSPNAVVAPGAAGGAHLAFQSYGELTGYDNEDASSKTPGERIDDEVYLYDAETGALACASCNPSGARPLGSAGLAEAANEAPGGYGPRDLLADGRLFFNSSDALALGAHGGVQNVYEYEDGRISPISSPAGRYGSSFLDASADGTDVFFASSDQLLPEDKSSNVVVYDARQEGGFPLAAAPAPCTTNESCEPAASSPPAIYGSSGTGAFNGPGNPAASPPPATVKPKPKPLTRAQKLTKALKQCRKDRSKKKRTSCEKQARKKYGAKAGKASANKPATRATNDRRAGR